jgi:hypothetical protein
MVEKKLYWDVLRLNIFYKEKVTKTYVVVCQRNSNPMHWTAEIKDSMHKIVFRRYRFNGL